MIKTIEYRSGFMTLLAIALLVLVSAALAGMSRLFVAEARSARQAEQGAQVRQFLAAGEAIARADHWENRPAGAREEVKLPQALTDSSAQARLRLGSRGPGEVVVEARWEGREEKQVVRLDGSE